MKKLLLISILFCSILSFGQTKYLIQNNEIVYSGRIPSTFEREGAKVYGYDNLSDSIHYIDGWRSASMPNINSLTQSLGQRYYNQAMDSVTWVVINKSLPTLSEAKEAKIKELRNAVKELYNSIQWVVEMYRMNDEQVPNAIKTKKQQIRTNYESFKANVNSKATVLEVLEIEIPYDQIATIQQQLDDFY